jgi:putative ABC transport system permease protein
VLGITQLLSKDFLMLVFIAFAIAAPLSYWGMNQWLEAYPYRVTIEWWVFVLAAALAMLIALLTISYQAIKAARANPIKSLRTE